MISSSFTGLILIGTISVCLSYFLVVVDVVVETVEGLVTGTLVDFIVVTLDVDAVVSLVTVDNVTIVVVFSEVEVDTTLVFVAAVVLLVVVFLTLHSTLVAWSQVMSSALYRVPSLQVIRCGTPPAHRKNWEHSLGSGLGPLGL